MTIRLGERERSELQSLADRDGVPISQIVRKRVWPAVQAPGATGPVGQNTEQTTEHPPRPRPRPAIELAPQQRWHIDDLGDDALRQNNGAMRK